MKVTRIQWVAAALACAGFMLPNAALAAVPAAAPSPLAAPAAPSPVNDVALRAGGLLVGQVVDAHAKPVPGAAVSVCLAGKEVVRTTSDKNGVFAAKGLRGGEYEVVTTSGSSGYRLWAAKTAPPNARSAAQVVANQAVVAGQAGPGPILSFVTQYPFVSAGVVAGGIAGGIAAADDDEPGS